MRQRFIIAWILLIFAVPGYAQQNAGNNTEQAVSQTFYQLVNEGKKLSDNGRYYEAAVLLHEVIKNAPKNSEVYQDAEFYLGKTLMQLGLYVSAYTYFDEIADVGINHKHYKDIIKWLLKIHRNLVGEQNSLYRISQLPEKIYPADLSDEIYYDVGQYEYNQDNLDNTIEKLKKVSQMHPILFIKANYLMGITYVRKYKMTQDKKFLVKAGEAFLRILSFIKASKLEGKEINKLKYLSIMGLARIYYTAGKFKKSIEFYQMIPQNSPYWLDSMFERAWAYFWTGNYGRSLGTIETLRSPYFKEKYYPEAFIIKAFILFTNCHFKEAIDVLTKNYKEYWAVWAELKRVLKTYKDPEEFYRYLARLSTKGGHFPTKIKRIFNAAFAEKKVRKYFKYVMLVDQEYKKLKGLSHDPQAKPIVDVLLPSVYGTRTLAIGAAGRLARDRMKKVYLDVSHILQEALKLRVECNTALQGKLPVEIRKFLKKESKRSVLKVDEEHVRWPFNGEYWKDELGSYYYPIKSYCK